MKKTTALITTLLVALSAFAQDFIYLPKSISVSTELCFYRDRYMFNGSGQITQIISEMEVKIKESNLTRSDYIFIPKYDKKTGRVASAKIYISHYYKDQTLDEDVYSTYDYKFNYVSDTEIELTRKAGGNVLTHREVKGKININEKGELLSFYIEDEEDKSKVEYDGRGNLTTFTAKETDPIKVFEYNDKKGALVDANVPKWLLAIVLPEIDAEPTLALNLGSLNNAVAKYKNGYADDDYDSYQGRRIEFAYEYNEEGYPASFKMDGSRQEYKGTGTINYSKKKVKK